MEKGKLIVIEGTDCSGKETQSRLLIDRLNAEGMKTEYFSYPNYSSPTGRIVGLSYLGKPHLVEEYIMKYREEVIKMVVETYDEIYKRKDFWTEEIVELTLETLAQHLSHGWFPEGAPNVHPKISSLYYLADRSYSMPQVQNILNSGSNLVLDRYTYSNMAHQGGKIEDPEERKAMFEWLHTLEMGMMGLLETDIRLFLHMPTDYGTLLRAARTEKLDENERDIEHLRNAERAYLEVANLYDFATIECVRTPHETPQFEDIKTQREISDEVYDVVKRKLLEK